MVNHRWLSDLNYLPLARISPSKFKYAPSSDSRGYFELEFGGPEVVLGCQLASLPLNEVDLILFALELHVHSHLMGMLTCFKI